MQPGTCLGDRYTLEEHIGTSENGTVWFGRDTVLDRPVRIKVLDPELARDEAVRDRFRRTALALASLDVPGIADVYDCVEQRDGDDVTVCQVAGRLEGEPLRKVLIERTLDSEDALSLVAGLGWALHAAHQAGLLHLNLKSSNLIVGPDDSVTIVDFGFAASGEVADDVLALGAIAYECVTGALPFVVVPDMPPVEAERQPQPLPAGLAPAVAGFVKRALSTDPATRFGSAAVLATECEQITFTNDVLGPLLARAKPDLGGVADAAPSTKVDVESEAGPLPKREPIAAAAPLAEPATAPVAEMREAAPVPAPDRKPRKRLVLVAALLLLVGTGGAVAVSSLISDGPVASADGGADSSGGDADSSSSSPGDSASGSEDKSENDPTATKSSGSSSASDDASSSEGDEQDNPDEPATVTVPGVVGDHPYKAYKKLRDAGLKVNPVTTGRGDHACPVTDQNPDGGTTLEKGSTVDVMFRMAKNSNGCEGNGGGGGDDNDNDD